jgi:hypothetical protein
MEDGMSLGSGGHNGPSGSSCAETVRPPDPNDQWKMACHWDLVGVTGPRDPVALKRSCKSVKKPLVTVDADEEVVSRSLPSPAADIASSSFALWNAANVLVTE